MVEQIFSGYLIVALPVAALAGLLSFLSPCVLPLVPGYISYAAGFSSKRGRILLGSSLFVFGFSTLFFRFRVNLKMQYFYCFLDFFKFLGNLNF